jgi:fengycin family lipopeptide synthetase D
MIRHQGISNLNMVFKDEFGINRGDHIIQFANISFDASVWEMFMALLNGAVLHLLKKEIINEYEQFHKYLNRNRITVVTLPPPYAHHLNVRELPGLRMMITAGSSPTIDFVKNCRKHFEYINAYGPTEVTICGSYWWLKDAWDLKTIPIGKPVSNTGIYIVNEGLQIQPVGIAGELCISGEGLARGYLNQPELTNIKFCRGPGGGFSKEPPGRRRQVLYKTGDLARWLDDGNIEFLGRIDHQVKVRGFRIELGEIEARLLAHDGVKEAVVLAREDEKGSRYICAHIVPDRGNTQTTTEELSTYLGHSLPDYMIPAFFELLEKIPLNTSGKPDRNALPEPGFTRVQDGYVPPGHELEEKLALTWQEILGVPLVGIKKIRGESKNQRFIFTPGDQRIG